MALSDKNIVITPNIGSSSDPKIVFSGADSSTSAQNITLNVYPTNNGTLSFEGSNGQLFSIGNTMSGTIYSVNDVSGIPSIEVLDTGLIKLGQYSGNILLGTGTDTGEAKLQVTGGGFFTGSIGNSRTTKGVYVGLSLGGDPQIQLQGNGATNPHIDFDNGTGDYDMRIILTGDDTLNITGGALTVESNTVLHAGNYTSYSPSLTGSGASGTWGINITGNAATLGGYAPNQSSGAYAIVQRDSNGYIQNNYFYTSGGGSERNTGGIGYFAGFNSSDYYIRSYTPAAAASAMGALTTSNYTSYTPSLTGTGANGTWGINVTGSAGSISTITLTNSGNGINPDNVTQNQIGYNTSVSLFGQTDGGLYSSAYSSSWIHQIYGDFRTGQIAIRGKNSGTWQTWRAVLDSTNYSSYVSSISGNAATATRAQGNFYIDTNYGRGIVGVYSSYRYQGVFAMGDSYKLADDGTSTGSLYGMAWSHPNTGGIAGNLSSHGLILMQNGGFMCALSTNIVASGNIVAQSDERLKTNWRDMPADYVTKLAGVKVGIYDRIDQTEVTQVGVSAQSLQAILPEAVVVAKDEEQTLSVNYGAASLASAIELAKEVVDLRARVASLEALISKLIKE